MSRWSIRRQPTFSVTALLVLALTVVACGQPTAAPAPTAPAGGSAAAGNPAGASAQPAGGGSVAAPSATQAATAPAQPTRLRIAYSELTPGQTVNWTNHEAGIYAKHGLDSDLQYISSAQTLAAVMSGEVDIAIGGGYAPLNARLAGSDVKIVFVVSNFYPYLFMVTPEINAPSDLRGKTLGVSRFGSASDVATRLTLKLLGLDADRDVTMLQVGSFQERMAAMRAGAIAGGLVSTPQTVIMRRQGFKSLYDLSASGEEELLNVAYATDGWLRNNEAAAQAFVNAMLEGIHFAKTNREQTKRVIGEYLKVDDDELLDDAYEMYIERNQPRVPPTGMTAARKYFESVAPTDPRAANVRVEDFFDTRFVERAQASGLVDRLWAGQ
jgi:NitT/TauT family transport system substrate-binding protein